MPGPYFDAAQFPWWDTGATFPLGVGTPMRVRAAAGRTRPAEKAARRGRLEGSAAARQGGKLLEGDRVPAVAPRAGAAIACDRGIQVGASPMFNA